MQTALMPSAGVSICSCFAAAAVDLWVIHFGFKTSNHKKGSAFVPTRLFFLVPTPKLSAIRGKTTGRKHSLVCRRASMIRITAPHRSMCVFPHARSLVLPVDVGLLQFISIHTVQCGFCKLFRKFHRLFFSFVLFYPFGCN